MRTSTSSAAWRAVSGIFAVLAKTVSPGGAQQASPPCSGARQSLDDAWWTGPMLAPSAATLPRGHFLIEPYLYDVTAAHSNGFGSLTYVLYGLTDRVTVGLIPTAGFNVVSNGPSSSGVGLGDLTLQAQYGLRSSMKAVGFRRPPLLCRKHCRPGTTIGWATDRATASAAEPIQRRWRSTPRRTSGCRIVAFCACVSTCRRDFRTT